MKTLHLSNSINDPAHKIYFEVFEHNGKKFSIKIHFDNGMCMGFNSDCCLSVMNPAGDFTHIVDNHMLGFTHKQLRREEAVELALEKFTEFVKNVY